MIHGSTVWTLFRRGYLHTYVLVQPVELPIHAGLRADLTPEKHLSDLVYCTVKGAPNRLPPSLLLDRDVHFSNRCSGTCRLRSPTKLSRGTQLREFMSSPS